MEKMDFIEQLINSYQYDLMLAFFISLTLSFLVMPVLIFVSKTRNLSAQVNERSSHSVPTPAIGGVAIYLGLIVAILIGVRYNTSNEVFFIMGSMTVLFFLGIIDDIKELGSKIKFVFQFGVAFVIAYFSELRISDLHGLMGIHEIPFAIQIALTVVIIVGIINAYNLIDGINGLAGALTLINSVVLALIFLTAYTLTGDSDLLVYCIITTAMAGSVIAFLFYNMRSKAMIFMGDTGSLVIGLLMAVMAAVKIGRIEFMLTDTVYSHTFIFGYSIIFLPVYDTLRVFTERILKGKSPFKADKTHIHHLLLEAGMNHLKATFVIATSQLIMIFSVFLIKDILTPTLTMILLTLLGVFLSEILNIRNLIRRKTRVIDEVSAIKQKNKLLK